MVDVAPEIRSLVTSYLQGLEQDNIHVQMAFLFGSRISGHFDRWSDLDIALVSDDFAGNRFMDKERIRKTTLSISPVLSPIPFTVTDFTDTDPFVRHIKETGVPVK
jgi:uncharacterized protein